MLYLLDPGSVRVTTYDGIVLDCATAAGPAIADLVSCAGEVDGRHVRFRRS
jgi:hypothetical protein